MTTIWTPVSNPPELEDDPTMWPTSKPVLGFCADGKMRIVTCESIDEDAGPQWISNCSERWNLTGQVLFWTQLPAAPIQPAQL